MNKIKITKNKGKTKVTYTARIQVNGERRNITRSSKKEVEKAVKEMYNQTEHGIVAVQQKPKEKITLNQWFELWIREYKELTVKESTLECYKGTYKKHVSQSLGKMYLEDITPENLQIFFNRLIKSKNLKSSSIQRIQAIISCMFKQAFINERIEKNPCERIQRVKKGDTQEKNVLETEHEQQFLSYFKNETYKNVCIIALYTGMRANEILGLTWEHVDFEKNVIHVRYSLYYKNKNNYKLVNPKTRTSIRDIPMTKNICELLQKLKKGCSKGFVFSNGEGKPFDYHSVDRYIVRAIKKMNADGIPVEHMSLHSFRHTFSSRCVLFGMSPKVVQTVMGHSDIGLTMNLYTHCQDEQKQKEMTLLENIV